MKLTDFASMPLESLVMSDYKTLYCSDQETALQAAPKIFGFGHTRERLIQELDKRRKEFVADLKGYTLKKLAYQDLAYKIAEINYARVQNKLKPLSAGKIYNRDFRFKMPDPQRVPHWMTEDHEAILDDRGNVLWSDDRDGGYMALVLWYQLEGPGRRGPDGRWKKYGD